MDLLVEENYVGEPDAVRRHMDVGYITCREE